MESDAVVYDDDAVAGNYLLQTKPTKMKPTAPRRNSVICIFSVAANLFYAPLQFCCV